jgi:hypothetical protein
VIGAIASRENGVVGRAELLAAEVTKDEIDHRLRNGLLIAEYPGVYRVGHRAPSMLAAYTAAVKACGDRAALAGFAAACLHQILKGSIPQPEVIAPTERNVEGVLTSRCKRLDERDVETVNRIRVTTVPRTIVDLAGRMSAAALARLCHEAGVRYRTTPRHVMVVLERRPNSPGAKKLRRVMLGDEPVTLSKLERRFLQLLREAGLPLPVMNRVAGGRRVDCRWPGVKLTVELDSYTYHGSRYAWEQDHQRRREAHARGDEFRRYTWADVFEDPEPMLAELRGLLSPAWPRA